MVYGSTQGARVLLLQTAGSTPNCFLAIPSHNKAGEEAQNFTS